MVEDKIKTLSNLKKYNEDTYENYKAIKEITKQLVGETILFNRGTKQKVLAKVKGTVECSNRIKVQNLDTGREYDCCVKKIDITKIL